MASSTALSPRASARRLYFWGAAATAAVAFVGFAHSYYLKSFTGAPALPTMMHIHGIVMTLWVLTFVVQVSFVAKRRVDLHRRVGVFGASLAAIVVIVGAATGIEAARLGHTPGPPPLVFLVVPIADVAMFTVLAGLGLYFRRKPEIHRRLMLLASIGILSAAFARPVILAGYPSIAPLVAFGMTDVFVIACAVYDTRLHRRLHPAFAYGGALVIASHPFRLWFGGTAAWMAIARWLAF